MVITLVIFHSALWLAERHSIRKFVTTSRVPIANSVRAILIDVTCNCFSVLGTYLRSSQISISHSIPISSGDSQQRFQRKHRHSSRLAQPLLLPLRLPTSPPHRIVFRRQPGKFLAYEQTGRSFISWAFWRLFSFWIGRWVGGRVL
jgi:hypothetical protein